MITIDLNKQALNYKGELATIADKDNNLHAVNLGEQLGASMAYSGEKDNNKIIKLWSWATLLGNGQPLQLDKADVNMLKDFVLACDITLWIKAQILEIIEVAKEV
jgi:hypothetical protein